MRRSLPLVLLACLGIAATAHAAEPAALTSASPAADSVAAGAPNAVELTFSGGVQPATSRIAVTGPDGKRVDKGPAHSVGDDHHLAVDLRQLVPGRYHVAWRITTRDAHSAHGSYVFDLSE